MPCDGKPREKREPSRPSPVPPSIPAQGRDPLRTTLHLPAAETHPAQGTGATACTSELAKQASRASRGFATGRMSETSVSGGAVIVRMGDADIASAGPGVPGEGEDKGRVDQQVGSLQCRARARLRQRPRCSARRVASKQGGAGEERAPAVAPKQGEVHRARRRADVEGTIPASASAYRARRQECLRRHRPLRSARDGTTCRANCGRTEGRAKLFPGVLTRKTEHGMSNRSRRQFCALPKRENRGARSRTPESWRLCAIFRREDPSRRREEAGSATAHCPRDPEGGQPESHKRESRAVSAARCSRNLAKSWKSRGRKREAW